MDVVFYNDVSVFGGHEVMFVNVLGYLLSKDRWELGVVYYNKNKQLESELAQLKDKYPKLKLFPEVYSSGRLQFLRALWAFSARSHLKALFNKLSPNCVVAVQGEISLSSVGIMSANDAGCYTLSYLPMAHTRKQRGESLAWLKEYFLRYYYRLPDSYITISKSVGKQIRSHGATQPIDIVENGISLDLLHVYDKAKSLAELGVTNSGYVAALCGRIEFKQKGHDILLQAIAARIDDFKEWTVLIIGSGPDQKNLENMIIDKALSDIVKIVPWQSDMSRVYSAIDMLLMPSQFEGVPVVLLEAMYYRLPIVASNIDAMNELLPMEWLFSVGDEKLFSERMLQVKLDNSTAHVDSNYELVTERFSRKRQEKSFYQVLNRCVEMVGGK
ncbi:MAG: glycosyltransferase family 4 protein [Woeseiaceae bacterium]